MNSRPLEQWNEVELHLVSCRSSVQFLQALEGMTEKAIQVKRDDSRGVYAFRRQLAEQKDKTVKDFLLDAVSGFFRSLIEYNQGAAILDLKTIRYSFEKESDSAISAQQRAALQSKPEILAAPQKEGGARKVPPVVGGTASMLELLEESKSGERPFPEPVPKALGAPANPISFAVHKRSFFHYLKSLFIVDESASTGAASDSRKSESLAREQLVLEEITRLQKTPSIVFPKKPSSDSIPSGSVLGPGFKPIVPPAGRIQLKPKSEAVLSKSAEGASASDFLEQSFSKPEMPSFSDIAKTAIKKAFTPIKPGERKESASAAKLSWAQKLGHSYNRFKASLYGIVWPGDVEGPSLAELYQPESMSAKPQFFVGGRAHEISLTQQEAPSVIELIPGYAYAQIVKETAGNDFYFVAEPELEPKDARLIEFIKKELLEIISVEDLDRGKIFERVDEIIRKKRLFLTPVQKQKVVYFLSRDLFGVGKIEPLMHDPLIEDVECDGVKIPVFVVHRSFGHLPTNISFDTQNDLENFVVKLAQLSRSYVSYADPLLNSILPDGSRVNAVLTSSVSTRGPTFTIRRFPEVPLSPINLILNKTIPSNIMAYLWTAIEFKKNILIIGPTASGKTTILNALAMFVPSGERVVSIEDTRELNIEHENWLPEVSRIGFGPPDTSGKRFGSVSLMDLIKESFRQRPDYLIVGEVRGEEAYVMFQGMASGHAALSTMHARGVDDVVSRLITPPINLYPSLLETVDIIIHVGFIGTGSIRRTIRTLAEVQSYNLKTQKLEYNNLYSPVVENEDGGSLDEDEKKELYGPIAVETSSSRISATEILPLAHRSVVLRKIMESQGLGVKFMQSKIEKRTAFLDKLAKQKVLDYKSFTNQLLEYLRNEK